MRNYDSFKGQPTFTRPPRDQNLPLALLFDYQGANSPEHPLFRYDQDGELKTILWKDGNAAIRRAASLVRERISRDGDSIPVVAVLAHVDSMTYFATVAGIMRAGYVPFPLSSRNSPAAIAELLQKKTARHIFVNSGPMKGLLAAAIRESGVKINIHDMPTFDELYKSDQAVDLPPLEGITQEDAAVILHSSGSTAFPKPVTLTMRMLMESAMSCYSGEIDVGSQILSGHAVPMFHLMGLIQIASTSYLGVTMAVFPPTTPPVIPTPVSVFNAAVATHCTLFHCVPTFLEELSQDSERVKVLSKFLSVAYGGGPLGTDTGDMLVKAGVKIVPMYGQTESGIISQCFPSGPEPLGWQWMRLSEHLSPAFVPYGNQENLFQLVLKKCSTHTPAVLNTAIDGVPALDTFDLVQQHPQNPNLIQIYGRADDQIVHSTGEKTNPVPIEAILAKDPNVASAIMFGRSKFHAGVIISPSPNIKFDPHGVAKLAEYRTLIWPTVQKANQFAPAHSKIFKEMILVANPNKPFEMTPKGTPRRNAVLKDYAEEIDEAYIAFDESSQVQFNPPKSWNTEDCTSFVRTAFKSVMEQNVKLEDDDDIFQKGCDSLQMTWIKNTVLHALKCNNKVNIREIPQNFVYAYPTARQLGEYMASLAQRNSLKAVDVAGRARQMKLMAEKYCKNFTERDVAHGAEADTSGAVLITGTTGHLGSYLLAKLLHSKDFTKIYALNRSSSTVLAARQESSFAERGLDTSLLQSPKLILLEGDLSKEFLGLKNDVHETIREELALIIHNAWHVDFNVSLSSLEPHLLGTRRLVDLALSSRREAIPKVVFVSSIAVFDNWHNNEPGTEGYLDDPAVAVNSGYGESKWCAETILQEASVHTPLKPVIVRVGQLSGGPNGEWNTSEWFPALVRSSQTLKKIPKLAADLSWVPIDVAAQAIIELSDGKYQYANLVHPRPIPTSVILTSTASLIGAEVVLYRQWMEELSKSADRSAGNPALRLLDFFQAKAASVDKADAGLLGFPSLSSARALECSQSLRDLVHRQLDSKDVEKWIAYWRKIGFLDG